MIIGHYATALVPYGIGVRAPLWVFLLCANLADFLWLALIFLGKEVPEPSSMWTATFQNLRVNMEISHGLAPTLILGGITGIVVFLIWRDLASGIWAAVLVLAHFGADLLSGFEHDFAGIPISLNLYGRAPHAALLVEAAFGALCVFWYLRSARARGDEITSKQAKILYALFIVGALVWLPTATIPLGQVFGIK